MESAVDPVVATNCSWIPQESLCHGSKNNDIIPYLGENDGLIYLNQRIFSNYRSQTHSQNQFVMSTYASNKLKFRNGFQHTFMSVGLSRLSSVMYADKPAGACSSLVRGCHNNLSKVLVVAGILKTKA